MKKKVYLLPVSRGVSFQCDRESVQTVVDLLPNVKERISAGRLTRGVLILTNDVGDLRMKNESRNEIDKVYTVRKGG